MKYFSTFSGIGGFELGIRQAAEKLSSTKPVCVGYSEIDKYAIQVYEKHFNHKNYGDITKINAKKLPDFDLLVGGFPCQAFSVAGKRKGFLDTRGALFFEIARIIKQKQPRLLLLENVKGLLSHNQGQTFYTIITTLDELGYDCQWQVLNSKNHGVPQNRERVFIVGHLRGSARPEVFPFIRTDKSDIQHLNKPKHSNDRVIKVPEATKKGYAEARTGQAINLGVINSKTARGRVGNIAQVLDTKMQQYTLTEDMQIRRLTPKECERLQGFPNDWTKNGVEGEISDTQRYKMLGNAVTVNVIKDIMIRILNNK